MFNLSDFLKDKLRESSQHFQVALQLLDLTPRKIKRILGAGYAMYRGTEWAKKPLFLHIEPTGVCNLKCIMCPRTESIIREMRHMKFEKFETICDAIEPIFIAFAGFGEPLLNPQIIDMVRYSVKKDITTRISSNATVLNPKLSREIIRTKLHQIWFSIDSPNAENFERLRIGADFNKTIAAIKEFAAIRDEEKSEIIITINFTIIKENVHEVPEMVRFCHNKLNLMPTFARGYGYDIADQRVRILKNSQEIQSSLREGARIAHEYRLFEVERNLKTIIKDLEDPLDGRGPCYFPYYAVAVSWDGKVSPCCLFYDYQMELGDLSTTPFEEIWNGRTYQSFRMNLKRQRRKIDICNTCLLNDISLNNIMHKISRLPGAKFFTKERYKYIYRGINQKI